MRNGNAKQFCSYKCQRIKRPFRVWDGEGKTLPDGRHLYTLLSCTDGRIREYIEDKNGLSTDVCLEFLTRPRHKAYNVWFSFGYDVNKILENIPLDAEKHSRRELWETGVTTWNGYRLDYTPRKTFTISNKKRSSFHSCDVFGFFQTSFLKACEDWKIDASEIIRGKEERNKFATWDDEAIREYNFKEMDLLLELCNKLREALYDADVLPQSWHGPGAIAATWLKREGIDKHFGTWPDAMHKAVMHAYFGGRIDISAIGEIDVYKYDIASAYPDGLTDCVSCRNIVWHYCERYTSKTLDRHGLYHVTWRIERKQQFGPFPWRNHKGVVLFPHDGEGWYWGVEVIAAMQTFPKCITIHDAWIPRGEKVFPFREAIRRDYKKRSILKAKGLGSNVAIKLALNSLYGKTCQHEARHGKPRWQNYIWGGYVTAYTRAKILNAMAKIGPENMVGIATDGIFLRCKLPNAIQVSKGETMPLGEWEEEGYTRMLIVAPGLYATTGENAKVYRSRGLPSKLNFGFVLRQWGCNTKLNTEGADSITSVRDTFVGMGRALHTDLPCGRFIPEVKTLGNVTIFGTSKRFPSPIQSLEVHGENKQWREFSMWPKPRTEKVISHAYRWRPEFDEAKLMEG